MLPLLDVFDGSLSGMFEDVGFGNVFGMFGMLSLMPYLPLCWKMDRAQDLLELSCLWIAPLRSLNLLIASASDSSGLSDAPLIDVDPELPERADVAQDLRR